MGEKGTGEEEKAAFVPYQLFIQSSNELTSSHSNHLSGELQRVNSKTNRLLKTTIILQTFEFFFLLENIF